MKNPKEQTNSKEIFPELGTCGNAYPDEGRRKRAGAHLKPKHTRPDDPVDNTLESKLPKSQNTPHRPVPNQLQRG